MARRWQSGFEQNSATSNIEWTNVAGSPTVQGTVVRSGAAAAQITSLSSGVAKIIRATVDAASVLGPFWFRFYLRVDTAPSAENTIWQFTTSGGTVRSKITLDSSGALHLYNATTQVGSASSALTIGAFYRVEVKFDASQAAGSDVLEARLNGTVFATSSTETLGGGNFMRIGGNLELEAQTQGDWYFDDVAVNDGDGSFQNGYPGEGRIIHLLANAAGDSNQWLNTAAGAGDANNYTLVDEVTPDDATTMIQSGTLDDIDMYNFGASGLVASDVINVVAVGMRFRNNVADATTAFRVRLEKTTAGTIIESASIIPNSTTWRTNAIDANVRSYPLVTYQDPDNVNWTPTTLDSLQAGVKLTAANVNRVQVSAVWVSIDYATASTFVPKVAMIM